jgi:hypothetical protein
MHTQVLNNEVALLEVLSAWCASSALDAGKVARLGRHLGTLAGEKGLGPKFNLLLDAALFLWEYHCGPAVPPLKQVMQGVTEYGEDDTQKVINSLDSSVEMQDAVITGLRGVVAVLVTADETDVVKTAHIVLELSALLEARGAEEDVLEATTVLKQAAKIVSTRRADLINRKAQTQIGGVVDSLCADFEVFVSKVYLRPFDAKTHEINPRPMATPLTRIAQTLSCVHAELLNYLTRMELQAGVITALRVSRKQYERNKAEFHKRCELTGSFKTEYEAYKQPYTHPPKESELLGTAGHNLYHKAIVLLNMATLRPNLDNKRALLEQAAEALAEAQRKESKLLAANNLLATGSDFVLDTRSKPSKSHKPELPAPTVLYRDATSMTLQLRAQPSFVKNNKLRSLMLFGKPSENGIGVSANNTAYRGCGVEIPLPSDLRFPPQHVSGLEPNTDYCFAVCGVDLKGKLTDIGATSIDVCTAEALPLHLLWGFLAIAARQCGIDKTRPVLVPSRLLNFDFSTLIERCITQVSNKFLTTLDDATTCTAMGPLAWAGRLDFWMLKAPCVEMASAASLYQLVELMKIKADLVEQQQAVWKAGPNAGGNVMGAVGIISKDKSQPLKTAAYMQLHLLSLLRPLMVALQAASVLKDHVLAMPLAERMYNTLVPMLRTVDGALLLPTLSLLFHILNQMRGILPPDHTAIAINKLSARLTHILTELLKESQPDLAKTVVDAHLGHASKAKEVADTQFSLAHEAWADRNAERDAVIARNEALLAPPEEDPKAKGKLAAPKGKSDRKLSRGKVELEPEAEEEKPPIVLEDIPEAEREPLPTDFYTEIREDGALTNYLLGLAELHTHGAAMAKVELGRDIANDIDAAVFDGTSTLDEAWGTLNEQNKEHPRFFEMVAKLCERFLAENGPDAAMKTFRVLSLVPALSASDPRIPLPADSSAAKFKYEDTPTMVSFAEGEVEFDAQSGTEPEELGEGESAEAKPIPFTTEQMLWLSRMEVLRGIVMDALCRSDTTSAMREPTAESNALGWEWQVTVEGALVPACSLIPEVPDLPDIDAIAEGNEEEEAHVPAKGKASKKDAKPTPKKDAKGGKDAKGKGGKGVVVAETIPEIVFDSSRAKWERIVCFTVASELASRSRMWRQVQNAARCMWNVLQSAQLCAADLAVHAHHMKMTPVAELEAQAKAAAAAAIEAGEEPKPPVPPVLDPVSCARTMAEVVLRLLAGAKEDIRDMGPFELEQQRVNDDAPPQDNHSASSLWFAKKIDLDMTWLARFFQYLVEVLFHAQDWASVVRLGLEWNRQTDAALVVEVMRFMLFSQTEIMRQKQGLVDAQMAQIRSLDSIYNGESEVIKKKREGRRSQRGKREEDARLEELRSSYLSERNPLKERLAELRYDLSFETVHFITD